MTYSKSKSHASMLKHVVERQVLDVVVGGVDVVVAVLESRLDDKCGWIAGLGGRCVVRAGVSTLGLDEGDIAVLDDDLLDELGQLRVDVVDDDADALRLSGLDGLLNVSGHVLLQHGLDIAALLLILGEDCLAPQQTTLFGRVPVELDGVLQLALLDGVGAQEDAESLENCNGTTPIVVRAGRSKDRGQPQVDGVLMGANNNRGVCLAGNSRDYRALLPRVRERLRVDIVGTRLLDDVLDLFQEPLGGLLPVIGLVVACVEAGELLEVLVHLRLGEVLEQRLNLVLERGLGWEDYAGEGVGPGCAEVSGLGDVHELLAILCIVWSSVCKLRLG